MRDAKATVVYGVGVPRYRPAIGECGPYPDRLQQQFECVVRRFETGGLWRDVPQELDAWSTPLPTGSVVLRQS